MRLATQRRLGRCTAAIQAWPSFCDASRKGLCPATQEKKAPKKLPGIKPKARPSMQAPQQQQLDLLDDLQLPESKVAMPVCLVSPNPIQFCLLLRVPDMKQSLPRRTLHEELKHQATSFLLEHRGTRIRVERACRRAWRRGCTGPWARARAGGAPGRPPLRCRATAAPATSLKYWRPSR